MSKLNGAAKLRRQVSGQASGRAGLIYQRTALFARDVDIIHARR